MTQPGVAHHCGGLRTGIKDALPGPLRLLFWMLRGRRRADVAAACRFLASGPSRLSVAGRMGLLERLYAVHASVTSAHTQPEALTVVRAILELPAGTPGCVVEAGCYKGGSTAKWALAARLVGRSVVAFDSFEGLPPNTEAHETTLLGEVPDFSAGKYAGTLDEVRRNLARFGVLETCTLVPGWFDQTMPAFTQPIAVAYLDVDLVSSTRTCVTHLYPLLQPGGALFSQDGHLPLIVALLSDEAFWRDEVGCPRRSSPALAGTSCSASGRWPRRPVPRDEQGRARRRRRRRRAPGVPPAARAAPARLAGRCGPCGRPGPGVPRPLGRDTAALLRGGRVGRPFEEGEIADTNVVFGSGAAVHGGEVVFVPSASTTDALFYRDEPPGTRLQLPALPARVRRRRPRPPLHLLSSGERVGAGGHRPLRAGGAHPRGRRASAPAPEPGRVRPVSAERGKPLPPPFHGFEDYRHYLVSRYGALAANARDLGRRLPMRILSTQSRGYDTTAINAVPPLRHRRRVHRDAGQGGAAASPRATRDWRRTTTAPRSARPSACRRFPSTGARSSAISPTSTSTTRRSTPTRTPI